MAEAPRYVVTGGPSAGKTTTLVALATHGYHVEREVARVYLERHLAQGMTVAEIRKDEAAFQQAVFKEILALEERLPDQPTFLDRGIYDAVAYCRFSKVPFDVSQVPQAPDRYAGVFLLEMGKTLEEDGVRKENLSEARQLERQLDETYREYGYDVIRVPFIPVADRVNLILEHVRAKTPA